MTHDAEHRVHVLTQYTPGARILLKRDQDDLTAVLQALADTRQQLDEARGLEKRIYGQLDRALGALHEARAERDEARQTARALRAYYLTGDASGLASTPGWLTDDPQPDPGPTRQGHASDDQPTGAPDA